jgi:hypothetical protein
VTSSIRRSLGITMVVAAVVLAGCTQGASSSGDAAESGEKSSPAAETEGPEQFTPVIMEVVSTPSWFVDTSGTVRLPYEVRLTNSFPYPATVTRVDVTDVETGDVLQSLTGDELLAVMSLQPTGSQPTAELGIAEVGVLWMDIPFDDPESLPESIDHTITITLPDDVPIVLPDPIVSTAGRVAIDQTAPLAIGPPLEGPGWVAFGSCCDGPHRRALQPVDNELWLAQRFAIDFNKIDEQDRFATGDPSLNESWVTFGQPVLAIADAEVVAAANDFPDQVSGAERPVALAEADGNYVILEVADGAYAFYAHLKPGSVTVKAGDKVERGQIIGHAGNSGSSGGPHLHFQMMDRPSALVANGIPYVFDSFTLSGKVPPIDEVMAGDPEQPVAVDTSTAGKRSDELPAGRDVVEFRAAG